MNNTQTQRWRVLAAHPLLTSIVSALIGAAATITVALITNNTMAHEYVSFNSINTLLQKYFVESGYVNEAILEFDTVDKQFEMLEEILENYSASIETSLVNMGLSHEKVSGMSHTDMLSRLPAFALELYNDNQIYASKNEGLNSENDALRDRIEQYSEQKTVELVESNLIIDGELMNSGDSIKNAVAFVDGNAYYSQALLNTYILSENLKYNTAESAVVYGNQKPEKVKLSWDSMVSDAHNVEPYILGNSGTFSMGKNAYGEGVVLSDEDYFYIHLRSEYSLLSFTYGHVDNSSQGNLELTILAMDDNGETYTTILKAISLVGEMEPKSVEVPLSYASAVKIVVSDGDYNARYGLANIFLYS